MNVKWMTAKRSTIWASVSGAARQTAVKHLEQLARPTLASFLAVMLAGGPLWAQDQQQQQPAPAPQKPGLPAPQATGPDAYKPGPTNPPIPVSLGVSKYNYTRAPRPFPNLIAPYRSIRVPEPVITNSPRIDQLIHDGKLELTLQDAVELALENSMDIAVQRYYPWIADVSILKADSGSSGFGTPGAAITASSANLSPFAFSITSYDPLWTSSVFFDDRHTPINNPFISGTGTSATAPAIGSHTAQYNNQYSQFFPTGTSLTVTYDNTRATSSPSANFFNPDVQSSLFVSFSQSLLSGFGLAVNHRNIIIAKNNRKIADLAFEQQAITTTTNAITAYWELVFARGNVQVQQQAVAVSQRLYSDNKKQLEIGTLAPLEVTRSEAAAATDQQNLIIAQTVKLQDEQILKNFISKDPLAANLINVEIIPVDKATPPESTEAGSFEESIKEAFQKRPELLEQQINITNAGIDVRATGIALRPTAGLFGQYTSQGLAGVSPITGTPTRVAGAQIVDANGNPIAGFFEPATSTLVTGKTEQGFTTAQNQIFHNQFPDYLVGVNVQIPIRNRAAQATNQRSILQLRQIEAQMQQLKNAAVVDVRNTYIALEQGRVQVATASEARKLQQQTFDAEQKKYQLGASTVYNVILTQRDLVNAQGAELRALANLLEFKAQYERAIARTLDVNRVTIADAKHGEVEKDTLIPGTLHGKVVGTENLLNLLPDGNGQK
jgi:outer membrane protein